MKKIILMFLLLISLTGCGSSSPPDPIPGKLTIINNSVEMWDARWNGVSFGVISSGASVTKEVLPGDKYLYVKLSVIEKWFMVYPSLKINDGEEKTYTFESTDKGVYVEQPE